MMTTTKKKKTKMEEINETPLPEAMIHHIQSFMTAKEAAQTTILSKSWHDAWLTRPTIALDDQDFRYCDERFEKFALKTVVRYELMNLKIESFRLRSGYNYPWIKSLIAMAMKLGPTDVELEFSFTSSRLPQEVLRSNTLVRLSVSRIRLEDNYLVRCLRLKTLTLERVDFEQRHLVFFGDLTSSCILLEELSVSNCWQFAVSRANLNELHKLRRLHLDSANVDSMFFTDFASRFPCLKDLSVIHCQGFTTIDIATTSLETISYKPVSGTYKGKFNVPNLRKFVFACCSAPTGLSIKGALKEWEFDISILVSYNYLKNSWLGNLKRLLTSKSKRSRITSLCIRLRLTNQDMANLDKAEPAGVDQKPPVVVDNLRIVNTCTKTSCALLVRLFRICRPKFITHCLHGPDYKPNHQLQEGYRDGEYRAVALGKIKSWGFYEREALQILCKKLIMEQLIAPNWGVPDPDMFGRFGLKRVNMEVFDKFGTEWRPLVFEKPLDAETIPVVNKRKVRFELIWN